MTSMSSPARSSVPGGRLSRSWLWLWIVVACTATTPEPLPAVWETPEPLALDAGRVTLHRLNSVELQNTLQELLGSELALGDTLPADPLAAGFANNAEALTLSTLYLESVESMIDGMIAEGLRPPITVQTTRHHPADESWSGGGLLGNIGRWDEDRPSITLYHHNSHSTFVSVAHSGPYTVRISACHEQFGNSYPSQVLPFKVDGEILASFDISQQCKTPEIQEAEIYLESGERLIELGGVDRELYPDGSHHVVEYVELEGPLDATGTLPPGRARLYVCDPEPEGSADAACARQIVHEFAEESWRRPLTEADVDALMEIYQLAFDTGSDVHESIAYAVKRTLLSPWFLFRVEVPDAPESTSSQRLSAHELAARLSYFLWSSQPDDALRAVADDGTLLDSGVLETQTRRMLEDPKAEALVEGFGAHWLVLRELGDAQPDTETYPAFDETLRDAMDVEVRDLLRRVLRSELSMLELLTAESSWLEPRLAEHYGVTQAEGGYASVPGRSGGGLLTSAAFLTTTSNPNRTSPVRRGTWVAKNLMCEEPPPPPDGVEQEFDASEGAETVPEQLAAHRQNPACAGCHDQLDPIGIALESFDGVGLFRTAYPDGNSIETAGELDGVGAFADVTELAAALASQSRTHRCMVQKAFTYALGRETRGDDWPFIAPVETRFKEGDFLFAELVVGIVQSEPFLAHRGGE